MKGLARSDPSSATFGVGSREARKHYGTESYTKYRADVYSERKRF